MPNLFRSAKGYAGYGIKPGKGDANKLRDVAKRLRYAGAYGAQPPTIHRVLLSAEDEAGNLVNPDLTQRQVYALHDSWMKAEPQWEKAWKTEMETWSHNGFLASPLYGRRREFWDGKETDIANWPILSMEGDLMSTITTEFMEALDHFNVTKQQGRYPALLINQCHDSLTVECDEIDGKAVAALMEDVMGRTLPGWSVPFTAEASIAKAWDKT
jgi:hypothetical protein